MLLLVAELPRFKREVDIAQNLLPGSGTEADIANRDSNITLAIGGTLPYCKAGVFLQ